jgi:hypothetical protein
MERLRGLYLDGTGDPAADDTVQALFQLYSDAGTAARRQSAPGARLQRALRAAWRRGRGRGRNA